MGNSESDLTSMYITVYLVTMAKFHLEFICLHKRYNSIENKVKFVDVIILDSPFSGMYIVYCYFKVCEWANAA